MPSASHNSLTEAQSRERKFHNEWANAVQIDELLVREAFEAPTAIENHYILSKIGELKGKRVLDLGCGAGESSVYIALQGAEVYACDIAEDFLAVAQRLASRHGVKIRTAAAEAGSLPYPDGFFDLVYGNGVLHHVDLQSTAPEVRRVLKTGGQAFFIEPLPYNPVINLYRMMAKDVRTPDEKPLGYKAIKSFRSHFTQSSQEAFWFFTLLIFFHFFFVRRWHPSKVRYWKKVIEAGEEYRIFFGRLQRWDERVLKFLPFLKPLCWNTVICVTK